jgi:multidrug efflux pump subunit AcrB
MASSTRPLNRIRPPLQVGRVRPPGSPTGFTGPPLLRRTLEQQQLAVNGMIKVAAAAIMAELILLVFLYERIAWSIIIIVTALISTGAVFVGLWITGVELNITAMMGMVMIIGIATEMAIFLVSEYQLLAETMPPRRAICEAALDRLRPITMSTLAMILALLPLGAAISGSGDQMLQPLAIAIISGIVVQLPLVLVAMPVVLGLTFGGRSGKRAGRTAATYGTDLAE